MHASNLLLLQAIIEHGDKDGLSHRYCGRDFPAEEIALTRRLIALLGFGAAAWMSAPRDRYIGWTHEQRKRHLHLIVNNARFLILPWIRSQNLASMLLATAARQLPDQWLAVYGYRPVLLETFVEQPRFRGTCYKAANWIFLGQTKGRGKLGPSGKQSVPIKDLWVRPLDRRFRETLTR